MVIAKKYIIVKYFEGDPKPTDLKLVEEELPPIKHGEFLAQAEYLSVDPYMRAYAARLPLNSTMIGSQVAKIIQSKNPDFPVGKKIVGYLGWRTHTIIDMTNPDAFSMGRIAPKLIPDLDELPVSLFLGALGMPGMTAYFGFLEICKPKSGEILVVSGAAGAVGSHVGQIGKILGMKVIGITGSDEKCKWITRDLGFNHAINYKTQNVGAELKKLVPNGVDCYFDNVGGELSSTIIYQMRDYGRISVCGSISAYNASVKELPKCTILQTPFIMRQLKMEGFIVWRWADRIDEGVEQNLKWIRESKLVYRETVTKGFDKMFEAFVGVLHGANTLVAKPAAESPQILSQFCCPSASSLHRICNLSWS